MRELVIVGAGGHGRELFATIAAVNAAEPTWRVLGFVDDAPHHMDRVDRLGAPILGDLEWLERHPHPFALGIGGGSTRTTIDARLVDAGAEPTTIVHPGAHLGPDVHLAEGVVVCDRCTVTTNVALRRHTHLNVGCVVQHDSSIGEFCQLSPGVFVNGDCSIGDDVFIGTGAIVTRGCSVGSGATIGAGSVVLHDVEAGSRVAGVPARPI